MPEISVNELWADQKERMRCEKASLDRCRFSNMLARMIHERASANSDSAVLKSIELNQRLTLLISRLIPDQAKSSYPRGALLRVLTRVDQAEAFANELLAADVGANIDTLAERLGKLIEDIGFSVIEVLDRERMARPDK